MYCRISWVQSALYPERVTPIPSMTASFAPLNDVSGDTLVGDAVDVLGKLSGEGTPVFRVLGSHSARPPSQDEGGVFASVHISRLTY